MGSFGASGIDLGTSGVNFRVLFGPTRTTATSANQPAVEFVEVVEIVKIIEIVKVVVNRFGPAECAKRSAAPSGARARPRLLLLISFRELLPRSCLVLFFASSYNPPRRPPSSAVLSGSSAFLRLFPALFSDLELC